MSLQERIKGDMKAAMRSKDVPVRDLLRVVVSFMDSKKTKVLDDVAVTAILKSLITGAEATKAFHEIEILEKYLPQVFDEAEHMVIIK